MNFWYLHCVCACALAKRLSFLKMKKTNIEVPTLCARVDLLSKEYLLLAKSA
jgi:hypothetical protein